MGDLWARKAQGADDYHGERGEERVSNWTARSVPRADSRKLSYGLALIGFLQALYSLSSRFYTSAAFERPLHLSVLSLLSCAVGLKISERWSGQHDGDKRHVHGAHGDEKSLLRRLRRRESVVQKVQVMSRIISGQKIQSNRVFWLMAYGMVLRVLSHWYILRTSQCSVPGLEAFLVVYVLLTEFLRSRGRILPATTGRWGKIQFSMFVKFSISWAIAVVAAVRYARIPTGTVCPVAWHYSVLVPYMQVQVFVIDARLIVALSRLRQEASQTGKLPGYAGDELKTPPRSTLARPETLMRLVLVSALILILLCIPSWLEDRNLFWALWFRYADARDLLIDGVHVATVLVCGLYLLDVLAASTVALLGTSIGLFGVHIPYYGIGEVLPPLEMGGINYRMAFVALNAAPLFLLLRLPTANPKPAVTTALHRWLLGGFLTVIGVCGLWHLLAMSPEAVLPLGEAIKELNTMGRNQFAVWKTQGSMSTSLELAVAAYTKRHGVPPPPNFDKWYQFAVEKQSPIIDDFAQIHSDLLPFWGVAPAEIRRQTQEIQRYASVEIIGLRIRNGAVDKSPHVHETHQWMIDSVARMVAPFAQWLPDMDVPINVADEPRVALPYAEMQRLKNEAANALGRLEYNSDNRAGIAKAVVRAPHWPSEFPDSIGKEGKIILPHGFSNYIRKPILYDLIAPTCPPSSPIHASRWWEASTTCTACLHPHSLPTTAGPLVHNATLAMDMCHQPDLAYLTGAAASPSAMFATSQRLLPVFSQGKLSGFSDILVPSPWSFDDLSPYDAGSDRPWEEKKESLFWRGGSTDGYAAEGSWTGFTRARFVNEAAARAEELQSPASPPQSPSLRINVSFSGDMSRCHVADCRSQLSTYTRWARLTQAPLDPDTSLPPRVNFTEHWRHKHLADLDGAGFSGRFIPFLKSGSLVYRAAMYRTWVDERVFAWAHYIPLDVRLGSSFWGMLDWLSGRHDGGGSGSRRKGDSSEGQVLARTVARAGAEWAGRALRGEDMQVYMFRLLLEWGRIVNDEREHLFYEG